MMNLQTQNETPSLKKLFQSIGHRISFLTKYFVNDNYKRVPLKEFIRHFAGPTCEMIAEKFVQKQTSDADYDYYSIKGFTGWFNYPRSLPFHRFAQVIAEGLQPDHWHYYEIPETSVNENDVIADCGSAEGFFAYKNKTRAQKIYCIEPLPLFVESLKILFNKSDNIEIIGSAVGEKVGEVYLEPFDIGSQCKTEVDNEAGYIKVPLTTIDSLFYDQGKRITYLKADLEGFEENMIRGSLKTIKQWKPKLAITTYHIGQDYKKIIELVKSAEPAYKYKIKGFEYDEGKPVMLHMWV